MIASGISISGNCSGTYDAATASIKSPNYPNQYDNNLNCVWTVTAPAAARLALHFNDFRTEPSNDNLFVYQGSNNDNRELSFSGNVVPADMYFSSTLMTFKFISDKDVKAKGFQMILSTVPFQGIKMGRIILLILYSETIVFIGHLNLSCNCRWM